MPWQLGWMATGQAFCLATKGSGQAAVDVKNGRVISYNYSGSDYTNLVHTIKATGKYNFSIGKSRMTILSNGQATFTSPASSPYGNASGTLSKQ